MRRINVIQKMKEDLSKIQFVCLFLKIKISHEKDCIGIQNHSLTKKKKNVPTSSISLGTNTRNE